MAKKIFSRTTWSLEIKIEQYNEPISKKELCLMAEKQFNVYSPETIVEEVFYNGTPYYYIELGRMGLTAGVEPSRDFSMAPSDHALYNPVMFASEKVRYRTSEELLVEVSDDEASISKSEFLEIAEALGISDPGEVEVVAYDGKNYYSIGMGVEVRGTGYNPLVYDKVIAIEELF